MAPEVKKKRVSGYINNFQGEETRSGSSSFHSQVIDEDEDETSRGKRSRRRLSFGSNTSGCSTTSSCKLLSKTWRSRRSFASKARHCNDADSQSSAINNRRVVVENLAEVWVEQQVAAGGGEGKEWLEGVAEKLSSTEEQLDILELDGMDLLDHDQELAVAILCDPDGFATELMDHILLLLASGQLGKSRLSMTSPLDAPLARGCRLWIRFTSIPMPLLPLQVLLRRSSELTCTNNGAAKQLVYVYGVVYAISNITRRIFRQRYICKVCKNKYDAYHGYELSLPPGCCRTWIREDIESHDYLPYQEILLGQVPSVAMLHDTSAAAKPFGQAVVSVSMFDDLTGRLQLGDSVAIIGHAAMHATSVPAMNTLNLRGLPPSGHRFADVRIMANNIFAPFKLSSLKVLKDANHTNQTFCSNDGGISLEKLCNAICRLGPGVEFWPKFLPIALLLSLVVSDSSGYDHQKKPILSPYPLLEASTATLKGGLCTRKQVHILIATKSFPCTNMLQSLQAATLYAARSMYDARGNANLGAKIKQEDASKDRQMLYAGCLALSKGGVLVLDLPLLMKSKIRSLCEAMDKRPSNSMQQCRPDQISTSPTFWGVSHEVSHRSRSGSNQSRTSSIHPALLRAFDIVLEEPLEMLSDSQVMQNLIININRSSNSSNFSADLQTHLLVASSIAIVGITDEAHKLLCSYYLALRRNKEYSDCTLEKLEDASVLTLQSLLRVAEACAKLCLSSQIREIPDATLAILLCESSHLTKFGRSFVEDHMATKPDKHRISTHDSGIFGMLRGGAFDQELRDFHSDLVSCLYHLNPED